MPYDIWADQGYLTLIDGPVISPTVVAQCVAEASAEYQIELLAYDRWRINEFTKELDAMGCIVSLQPFGQGFKDMAPAIDKLERLVAGQTICHGNNPVS